MGAGQPKEPPKLGWSNNTDLSLVVTAGNSAAQTWGFSRPAATCVEGCPLQFEATSFAPTRRTTASYMVGAGLEFPVGGAPSNPATSLVKPDPTLDVATYLVGGSYERNITPRFFWNAGASWDRNDDAGILNRYIVQPGSATRGRTLRGDASPPATASATPIAKRRSPIRRRTAGLPAPASVGTTGSSSTRARRSTTRSPRTSISPIQPTTRSTPPAR